MTSLAYAIRSYSLPMLLALMVHALAVFALWRGWRVPDVTEFQVVKSVIVNAALVKLKAQPREVEIAPTIEPATVPLVEPEAQPETLVTPSPVEAQLEERLEARPEDKLEEERKRAEEARARERSRIADWFDQALGNEPPIVAQVQLEVASQSYLEGIANLVAGHWSRPPSARNGMEVELMIELVPTGDVVGVTIVRSSDSAAFDRSAENAVRRARRFEVPEDRQLFERNFRKFRILFRPEDLMR